MNIEYEATFENIDKNEIRKKLKSIGAKLVKKEFLQKRSTFDLPKGNEIKGGWLRVRDEDDKITLTLKIIDGNKIENQKEEIIEVDSFKSAVKLLELIGCRQKAYQENKREIWLLNDVEICIDAWPFLESFVEVEGKSEKLVKNVSEKIGFDYEKAFFGCVTSLYAKKYNVSEYFVNNVKRLVFNIDNPFVKDGK